MSEYFDLFKVECSPKGKKSHTIIKNNTRFTLITPCLLRVEKEKNSRFCDEPTQSILFRDFDEPAYKINESRNSIEIKTTKANFLYSFSHKKMERIKLVDGRAVTNFKEGNLKGTARTLDVQTGIIPVGDGVISKNGVAVLDDSKSLVLKPDGSILEREYKEEDKYYFAYGNDYIGATKDLYKLTGFPPLIPRYALSNWWSRYKAYSQDEYLSLMDKFKEKEIPITVATVDMDWHWVDIKKEFGKDSHHFKFQKNMWEFIYDTMFPGWTGYSFNTHLFPDPQGFFKKLREDNLKVTFNIHPSQGVRWFEDRYEEMCKNMGQNPKDKKPVEFDITNKKFIENYFKVLHHPLEDMGVDFWWIDWQQGTKSKLPGLDPLWALNHYHYLDNARNGKRPLILSRFAGVGSQRYPVGFSGDTTQTWQSLDYQPHFTSTASNIAYPWWSHDIGGHCQGKKDDELYIRWVQLGVFSPIMRLHSTINEFMGKEPWNFSAQTEAAAEKYLRLRHKLLPYIYSMNYRTAFEGRAICEPMYYNFPEEERAYECKNEFFFGTELIVSPITEKTSPDTFMAKANTWIPKGRYTDIFTGRIYEGSHFIDLYRDIDKIPVLAKEGAIIPMSENSRSNDWKNPQSLEILAYRGNNSFILYEDDGETFDYKKGAFLKTKLEIQEEGSSVAFKIFKAEGEKSLVPQKRSFNIKFKDIVKGDLKALINNEEVSIEAITKNGTIEVCFDISPEDTLEIYLSNCEYLKNKPRKEALIETISKFQMPNDTKGFIFNGYVKKFSPLPPMADDYLGPIKEIEKLSRG